MRNLTNFAQSVQRPTSNKTKKNIRGKGQGAGGKRIVLLLNNLSIQEAKSILLPLLPAPCP